MAAFDAELMVVTSGALTSSRTSTAAIINGTGIVRGMSARIAVPSAYNDADTLLAKVAVSDNGTDYVVIAQSDAIATLKTNPRDIYVPFATAKKYAKIEFVGVTTTAANLTFGVVQAGFVNGLHLEWSR